MPKKKRVITDEERARLREIGRRGGQTRAKQFTRAFQKRARRNVKPESLSRSGAKGAAVTIQRHGMRQMREQSRQYRLRKPSPLELQVIGVLARLKVKYEREFVVCEKRGVTVDFWLPESDLAIEVDGAIHDPGKPNHKRRLENATEKRALLKAQGRRLLVLHHSEFKQLERVIERVQKEVAA